MVRKLTVSIAVGGLFLGGAAPASGQPVVDFSHASNWFVGYVANAPQQLLGFGTGLMVPGLRGFGVYTDVKITTDSRARERGFIATLTPDEALALEDIPFRDDSAWATVNLAVVRGITEELAVYLGGGAAWRTIYSQFFDETGERGELGHYWVKDEDRSQVHANILAGAFFRMGNRLVFQFGAETAPAGFSAGMHLLLW
jgi:hypothetical protein